MEKLYIALVDTPGIFAGLIRRVIKINYIHVVLSLDENLEDAYSVGRRNPFIPYFSGFEQEDIHKIYRAFPTARYKIYSINCTMEQKEKISCQLKDCYRNRFHFHYCMIGLPFLLAGKAFYQHNHYTCSSFVGRILQENGVISFSRHFSLITPRHFYEYPYQNVVFEGTLRELCCNKNHREKINKEPVWGILHHLFTGALYES